MSTAMTNGGDEFARRLRLKTFLARMDAAHLFACIGIGKMVGPNL